MHLAAKIHLRVDAHHRCPFPLSRWDGDDIRASGRVDADERRVVDRDAERDEGRGGVRAEIEREGSEVLYIDFEARAGPGGYVSA